MKVLKIAGLVFFSLYIAACIIATLPFKTNQLNIPEVSFKTYAIKGLRSQQQADSISAVITKMPGVSACAINYQSGLVVFAFYETQVQEARIIATITQTAHINLADAPVEKVDEHAKGCPVMLTDLYWHRVQVFCKKISPI